MTLPYLLTYPDDPKMGEAYILYQNGGKQRDIAKDLGIPLRSLARRCSEDGWEFERKTRRAEAETPVLAAVAAEETKPDAKVAASVAAGPESATHHPEQPTESKDQTALPGGVHTAPAAAEVPPPEEPEGPPLEGRARMEHMLKLQQTFSDRLMTSLMVTSDQLLAKISKEPRMAVAQLNQVTKLGVLVCDMQRKAYRVPDKMELEDTTPRPEDRVRKYSDDQLDARLEAARLARLEAERRGGVAPAGGETPPASVN